MKTKLTFIALLSLLFIRGSIFGQTYSAAGGFLSSSGLVTDFPLNVSALSSATIDTVFGLESVCINLDCDGLSNIMYFGIPSLELWLISPDGAKVNLTYVIVEYDPLSPSVDVNYVNTCFNGEAALPIVKAQPPFTGTYKPQGDLGSINNGQNGNGQWKLQIISSQIYNNCELINWSITFGSNPGKPFIFSNFSSNLPIVVVNTNGLDIPDDPKITAEMGIINNGTGVINHYSDAFNGYNGYIGIEIRGNSASLAPKKSYGFETRNVAGTDTSVSLLGMPKESDWILNANYFDATLLRNSLSICNEIMCTFVETQNVCRQINLSR